MLAASRDAVQPNRPGEVQAGQIRIAVTADVTNVTMGGATLLAPESVYTVDRPALVYTSGKDGPLATVELASSLDTGQSYRVNALVRPSGKDAGAPTQAALAAAGTVYPDWVQRYRTIQSGSAGPLVKATADGIVATLLAERRDPFHIADAVQTYLYSGGGFKYKTDVRDLCSGSQLVDCFLTTKQGYCEYFATAMVMMLREPGRPRPLRQGLPARAAAADGSFEVDRRRRPRLGPGLLPRLWLDRFDPTPGRRRELGQAATTFVDRQPGAGHASRTAVGPSQSGPAMRRIPCAARCRPCTPAAWTTTGGDTGPLASAGRGVIGLSLLLAFGAWRSRTRRRRLRAASPTRCTAACRASPGRLGFGQLPTQTAYEYAGALGELCPPRARSCSWWPAPRSRSRTAAGRCPGRAAGCAPRGISAAAGTPAASRLPAPARLPVAAGGYRAPRL